MTRLREYTYFPTFQRFKTNTVMCFCSEKLACNNSPNLYLHYKYVIAIAMNPWGFQSDHVEMNSLYGVLELRDVSPPSPQNKHQISYSS